MVDVHDGLIYQSLEIPMVIEVNASVGERKPMLIEQSVLFLQPLRKGITDSLNAFRWKGL